MSAVPPAGDEQGTGPSGDTMLLVERIAQLEAQDLDDLCRATVDAITTGGGFGWLAPPAPRVLETYWKGVLLVPERQLFVGRLNGTVAGAVQLVRPPRNNEAQAFAATLAACFVAPWARGYGLARALSGAVEAAAREGRFQLINLDLRETQRAAIRLFEGLGYQRWGDHPYYAKVGDRFVRGFHYFKFIDPAAAPPGFKERSKPPRPRRGPES